MIAHYSKQSRTSTSDAMTKNRPSRFSPSSGCLWPTCNNNAWLRLALGPPLRVLCLIIGAEHRQLGGGRWSAVAAASKKKKLPTIAAPLPRVSEAVEKT